MTNLNSLSTKAGTYEKAFEVNNKIKEFTETLSINNFKERLDNSNSKTIIGYVGDEVAGYASAYDRYQDGSVYCWMVGVIEEYRRMGLLTLMMQELEQWAKESGYKKIKIKTRNNRKEMQHYLISRGYEFTDVEKKGKRSDYRLIMEKDLA